MPIPLATVALWASRGYAAFQVAEQVRAKFCEFQQRFPEFTDRMVGALPAPGFVLNPIVPLLCPNAPNPINQVNAPFSGGQCCGDYRINYTVTSSSGSSNETDIVRGKIGNWRHTESVSPPDPNTGVVFWNVRTTITVGMDCPGTSPREYTLLGAQNSPNFKPFISNFQVTRLGGLPDNCGDAPIRGNPALPTPNDLNFNVTIPFGNRNITVPVQFNFNLNPTFEFNFSPTISFSTPFGDLVFSPDGLDIYFPGTGTNPGDPPIGLPDPRLPGDRPPPLLPPGLQPRTRPPGSGGGSGNCPDVNLQPILTALEPIAEAVEEIADGVEELLDCDRCKRPLPEQCTKRLVGTGQGIVVQLGALVEWVGVEIVEMPSNAKGYFAVDSPDVWFAGWHSFGGRGCAGVRTPIQYQENLYGRIEGSSNFSAGLQNGWNANYYVYEHVPPEED